MSPLHLAEDPGADDPVALEPLARALVAHRSHVLLCGNDGPRLDRASRWLTRRLRAEADFAVELCLPSTTEALLQRFNDRLQSVALIDARDTAPPPARRVVWAVPAGGELEQHDLALLVRIAQDFPAAGVRLLVVLDDARQTEALGCRSSEWLVWQAEAPADVDDAVVPPPLTSAPAHREASVPHRSATPAVTRPVAGTPAEATADPAIRPAADLASERPQPPARTRPDRRRSTVVMAAVSLGLLATSAAVVGAWYREPLRPAAATAPAPSASAPVTGSLR